MFCCHSSVPSVSVVIFAGLNIAFCSSDHSKTSPPLDNLSALVVGCDNVPHIVGEQSRGNCSSIFINCLTLAACRTDLVVSGEVWFCSAVLLVSMVCFNVYGCDCLYGPYRD